MKLRAAILKKTRIPTEVDEETRREESYKEDVGEDSTNEEDEDNVEIHVDDEEEQEAEFEERRK